VHGRLRPGRQIFRPPEKRISCQDNNPRAAQEGGMELLIDIAIVVGIEYLLVARTFWAVG
jgi:hypothetical protein